MKVVIIWVQERLLCTRASMNYYNGLVTKAHLFVRGNRTSRLSVHCHDTV